MCLVPLLRQPEQLSWKGDAALRCTTLLPLPAAAQEGGKHPINAPVPQFLPSLQRRPRRKRAARSQVNAAGLILPSGGASSLGERGK